MSATSASRIEFFNKPESTRWRNSRERRNFSQKSSSPDIMDLTESPTAGSKKTSTAKPSVKSSAKRPRKIMPKTLSAPTEVLDNALEHLRENVFPALLTTFSEPTTGGVLAQAQKELLKVVSFLFHAGDVISTEAAAAGKNMVEGELQKLEKEKARYAALEKEVRDIRHMAQSLESENIRLTKKEVRLEEEKAEYAV